MKIKLTLLLLSFCFVRLAFAMEQKELSKNSVAAQDIEENTVKITSIVSSYKDILVVAKTDKGEILKKEIIKAQNPNMNSNHLTKIDGESTWIDLKKRNGKWDKLEIYDANTGELLDSYIPSGKVRKMFLSYITKLYRYPVS